MSSSSPTFSNPGNWNIAVFNQMYGISPKASPVRVVSKLQGWTRQRNWLKGRIMGCFAAFNSFAHRYSVFLSDEEKMKVDLIMNQVDELMKDWREQQIKMKETIK